MKENEVANRYNEERVQISVLFGAQGIYSQHGNYKWYHGP